MTLPRNQFFSLFNPYVSLIVDLRGSELTVWRKTSRILNCSAAGDIVLFSLGAPRARDKIVTQVKRF